MTPRTLHPLVHFLHRLGPPPGDDHASDGQLVARFALGRDERAFATLLQRHGPLVWGLCRRWLSHPQDAEDAFQATFLLLVRKAGSLRNREAVGSWLYGVAYRIARRACLRGRRQKSREQSLTQEPVARPGQEVGRWELGAALADALNRLPENYRAPILLCDLEGKTHAEPARQLGCPRATVATRLGRARARLRRRLAHKGLGLFGAGLAATLPEKVAQAVPTALLAATRRACLLQEVGSLAALGPRPVALAKGAGSSTGLLNLKGVVLAGLLAVCTSSAGWIGYRTLGSAAGPPVPKAEPVRGAPPRPAQPAVPEPPADVIAAWTKAGASYGSLKEDAFGALVLTTGVRPGPEEVPAFQFTRAPARRLADLPVVGVSFGLQLQGAWVTGAGLQELAGLRHLEVLDLVRSRVTDAGLKELAGLRPLRRLYLSSSKVTDAGLKPLAGLTQLQALSLFNTQTTDAGLKELAGLAGLQRLYLGRTGVTDAGLKELAGLRHLQNLDLENTAVTDAGLKELRGLKQLRRLDLHGTPVTDVGLRQLAGLKQLRTLYLSETRVTDAGLGELRRAVPRLEVIR
jgi:RNA polymerase sigma factor (sigma-70 family)